MHAAALKEAMAHMETEQEGLEVRLHESERLRMEAETKVVQMEAERVVLQRHAEAASRQAEEQGTMAMAQRRELQEALERSFYALCHP